MSLLKNLGYCLELQLWVHEELKLLLRGEIRWLPVSIDRIALCNGLLTGMSFLKVHLDSFQHF